MSFISTQVRRFGRRMGAAPRRFVSSENDIDDDEFSKMISQIVIHVFDICWI